MNFPYKSVFMQSCTVYAKLSCTLPEDLSDICLPIISPFYMCVVGQNVQVEMKFLCLLTLIIHGS